MRHQSLAHLYFWREQQHGTPEPRIQVPTLRGTTYKSIGNVELESASSTLKIKDVPFQAEDSARVRSYKHPSSTFSLCLPRLFRDSGDDYRVSLLKIHPVVVAGAHTELHFEIDANGCIPILLTRTTGSPWACAYEL